jgi:hypothetical protein
MRRLPRTKGKPRQLRHREHNGNPRPLRQLNIPDRQPLDPQQQARPRSAAATNILNLRTLRQARDLSFVTMNCLTTAMITEIAGPSRQVRKPGVPGQVRRAEKPGSPCPSP